MIETTRVLFQYANEIKKMFFISASDDGSIYWGPSQVNPKEMLTFAKSVNTSQANSLEFKFNEGQKVDSNAIKFSYHPRSQQDYAKLHTKVENGQYLTQASVKRLTTDSAYAKLFMILPQNPSKLQMGKIKKDKYDLIIPIDSFQGKPFSVNVYLAGKKARVELPAQGKHIVAKCENREFILYIHLQQLDKFLEWPEYTTFVTCLFNEDGKEYSTFA